MGSESGRSHGKKGAERRDAVIKRNARLRAKGGRTSRCYRRRGYQRARGMRVCALYKRVIIRVEPEWGGSLPFEANTRSRPPLHVQRGRSAKGW